MGIFREDTEEEKKIKYLIKFVNASNINFDEKRYLLDLIDKAKNDDFGIFLEFDFFSKAVEKILAEEIEKPDVFMNNLKSSFNYLLPYGTNTEDYESTKSMILQNFIKKDGLIDKDLFDSSFYSLFDNRLDYLLITNLMLDDLTSNDYYEVIDYANKVSPYCSNQTIFKNELISFMNDMYDEVDDIDEYKEKRLIEVKKRVGIYPIDEKTLALISSEAEKAQGLIEKLDSLQKKISKYEDRVDVKTSEGKAEIQKIINDAEKELAKMVTKESESIVKQLDSYILSLEDSLKASSDAIFNDVLREAQQKIQEIRLAARNLQTTTTTELLKIQRTTADSVEQLRAFVEDDEKVKELLQDANDNEKIKEALLNFQMSTSSPTGIIIPGNERVVVPANPSVIIPQGESTPGILPAFDEAIPFDVRMDSILEQKKLREQNGEIFHEMTDEVISCILEGDWPYLWGPSGCGKSYAIKQIASLIGIDVADNGKITDKYSIMAYNDPQGRFRATQAFIALTYGKLLLLDEFDNGNTDTQVVLNELYSGLLDVLDKPSTKRFVTFAEDMTVPINPNFRMISAGNTTGEGENAHYSSRGKIDESVQERMTPKKFNYDNRVEERIFGEYKEWYDLFIKFRQACDSYATREGLDTAQGIGTTRDAAAIVKYIKHNSKSVDQVLREKFIQTKPDDYLRFLSERMKEYYGFKENREVNVGDRLDSVDAKTLAKRFVYDCSLATKEGKR